MPIPYAGSSFTDGFYGAQDRLRQQGMDELKQAWTFAQLQQAMQAQAEKQKAATRDAQYRGVISNLPPDAKPEDVLRAVTPFVSADDLFKGTQSSIDRRAVADQTKQIALQNLGQRIAAESRRAYEFAMTLPLTERKVALAEIGRRAQQIYQAGQLQIAAGNLNYNTGADTTDIMDAVSQLRGMANAPQSAAPQGAPSAGLPSGVPASDSSAYNAVRDAAMLGMRGVQVGVDRQVSPEEAARMGMIPGAGPAPTPVAAPPNNLDARDLMLQGMRQQPAPATTQVAGALPPMPPEIAKAPPRVQNQWRLQQTRTSIAGSGSFTPAALEFVAKQYLTGDRQAVQGFARNATARIALQNAIVDEATKQGMTPEQVAAKIAEFAGTIAGSRTVGQRAANISLAATEAEEMLGIVKEQSDQFPRSSFVPWNMALRAYESGTGSPEISAFGASINALVNVYARAINPTGVPTVSDKEHARAVLNTVQSPEQVDAVLGIIRRELEIAKRAPASVRAATRRGITGESEVPTFSTEAEAEAAKLPSGTRVKIGGKMGVWK